MPLRDTSCCLLGTRNHRHTPSWLFQDSILQGQLDLLPFAPRLLSYLRIKHRVTVMPARLDTRPVASGYRGGIRTRLNNAAFPSHNRVFSSNWHFIAEALKQKAEKALQGLLDRVVVVAETGGWVAIRTLAMNCDRRIQESKRFVSRRSAGAANIIA